MTREDKELLLKDLCARLPYGVKVKYSPYKGFVTCTLQSINPVYDQIDLWSKNACFNPVSISKIKPYLFPLSSMTDKQYDEFFNYYHNIEIEEIKASDDYLKAAYLSDSAKYEWLNRNKFDWRYLIDKGLAIDCTNLNIY